MEPVFEVVGEAEDGMEAIEFAQKLDPDVILMDVGLPGINGVEVTSPYGDAPVFMCCKQKT